MAAITDRAYEESAAKLEAAEDRTKAITDEAVAAASAAAHRASVDSSAVRQAAVAKSKEFIVGAETTAAATTDRA